MLLCMCYHLFAQQQQHCDRCYYCPRFREQEIEARELAQPVSGRAAVGTQAPSAT